MESLKCNLRLAGIRSTSTQTFLRLNRQEWPFTSRGKGIPKYSDPLRACPLYMLQRVNLTRIANILVADTNYPRQSIVDSHWAQSQGLGQIHDTLRALIPKRVALLNDSLHY